MPALVRGDARSLPLADESVDLIVTSPPYFGLRDYGHDTQIGAEATPAEFIAALVECTREMARVLKPSGSIFVNLGDKYSTYESRPGHAAGHKWAGQSQAASRYTRNAPAAYGVPYKSLMGLPWRYALACMAKPSDSVSGALARELIDMIEEGECSFDVARGILDEHAEDGPGIGLILRQELIWSKTSVAPTRITDRARRTHEHVFHFTKREKYFSAMDDLREGESRRFPESVRSMAPASLRAPAELGAEHHAIFPTEWPRWIVTGWCPPDGVVLDPFGGTGTTALVATALGRTGISVDLSEDYQRLAAWRASDSKERACAAGMGRDVVARVAPSIPGQIDLFGEAS